MAANVNPVFGLTPNVGWAQGALTANTTIDLTAGTIYLIFTAGANGSYLDEIWLKAIGTNVPSMVRFWLNNGATTASAGNNTLIRDATTPTTTASNTSMQPDLVTPIRKPIPATYRVYATLPTGVAAGFDITAYGMDF